jgi:mono/diheme cytochrome c family protein
MRRSMLITALLFAGCAKEKEPTGEAPRSAEAAAPAPAPAAAAAPTAIEVPRITVSQDVQAIAQGKDLFAAKGCIGCHKIGGGKLVGPDLKGVTARRDQEWVERMILRPDVMTKEDPTAKKLFVEHLVQMPNQGVDPQRELPLLLAFLKSNER